MPWRDTQTSKTHVPLTLMTTECTIVPLQPLPSIQPREPWYDSGSQPASMACHWGKWLFKPLASSSKQPCHHNHTTGRQICFDMSAKELPGSGTWAGNNTDTARQALHDIIKVFERVHRLDCQRNPHKKKVFFTIEFWGQTQNIKRKTVSQEPNGRWKL